jgi:hypothetical protein
MKKTILISLLIIFSITSLQAQIYGTIQGNSTNNNFVGIGTPSPNSQLVIAKDNDAISLTAGNVSCLGFNRNVLDGEIFNTSKTAWQFSSRNEMFTLEGYNGAPHDLFTVLKNGNIGIGTNSPTASLHIKTPTANFLIENSGQEGAYLTINSGRFNRPAITSYKQTGTEYWNSGILYDESGNQKYSIGTTQLLSSSKLTIQSNGNIGLGTITPLEKLQIGEFNNNQSSKISIPGVYNFEEIKLGQYGNGAGGLEFINHTNHNQSYGVRFFSNIDSGIKGLQIQTANPSDKSQDLSYITRLAITTDGNIGIGTIVPDEKLTVNGKIHAQEIRIDLSNPMTKVPDYVFANDYKLKSLQEVEEFIKQNSHLPEIPSVKEIEKNGLLLAEMNMSLLKKIEEITLYMIEIKKENETMKKENKISSQEIETLKKEKEGFKSLSERLTKIENQLK